MSLIRRAFEKRPGRELGRLTYGFQIWRSAVVGKFHVERPPNLKYVSQTPIPPPDNSKRPNTMSHPTQRELQTAETFIDSSFDLPDMGQWAELDRGRVTLLEAPDEIHGRIVLNLTKSLGEFLSASTSDAYPCFDLGLVISRDPDTVWFPAISVFTGSRFSETAKPISESIPRLVVEIASTPDRRKRLSNRVLAYHERGVEVVWAIDPDERQVNVLTRGRHNRVFGERHELLGEDALAGFSIHVPSLFAQPKWWK